MKAKLIHCADCKSRGKSVFCDLCDKHLDLIDAAKVTNRYLPHQVVFYEGNKPFGVYCMNSGKVKVYKSDPDGHQDIVRIAGPGDLLGYRCLLSDEDYTATAETIEEAEICFIDKQTFISMLKEHPTTAFRVMATLARDVRQAEEQVSRVVHRSVRERLAELFLIFRAKHGVETPHGIQLDMTLTRAEWAEIIGTTQETVIRLFSDFREEKLIHVDGRAVTLLDLAGLTTAANIYD